MSAPDIVVATAARWVEKAEGDLVTARNNIQAKTPGPTDSTCFHAQQCVEKYLKALLVYRGIDFPRTHDIEEILSFVPPRARPVLTPEDQRRLTRYATVTRYPGDYDPIPLNEARRAMLLARKVRAFIRKRLPVEALTLASSRLQPKPGKNAR